MRSWVVMFLFAASLGGCVQGPSSPVTSQGAGETTTQTFDLQLTPSAAVGQTTLVVTEHPLLEHRPQNLSALAVDWTVSPPPTPGVRYIIGLYSQGEALAEVVIEGEDTYHVDIDATLYRSGPLFLGYAPEEGSASLATANRVQGTLTITTAARDA